MDEETKAAIEKLTQAVEELAKAVEELARPFFEVRGWEGLDPKSPFYPPSLPCAGTGYTSPIVTTNPPQTSTIIGAPGGTVCGV